MKRPTLKNTAPVFARGGEHSEKQLMQNILIVLLFFFIVQALSLIAHDLLYAVIHTAGIRITGEEQYTVPLYLTLPARLIDIALVLVYCRFLERRGFRSMGFTRSRAVSDYLIGIAAGAAMLSASIGIAMLGGGLTFAGTGKMPVLLLLLFIIGWMIQGFSEELGYRSYLMISTGAYHKPLTALLVSAVCFAAGHCGNQNITALAYVNLALYAVFAGIYFLRTDSVWGVAAMHSTWNFMQGTFYGIEVSGNKPVNSVLVMSANSGKDLLSGGTFGLEGGLAVTAVLVVSIAVVLLLPQRKQPDAPAATA